VLQRPSSGMPATEVGKDGVVQRTVETPGIEFSKSRTGERSPRWELNPRPTPYQGVALPLSYLGPRPEMVPTAPWTASAGLWYNSA
jgi:hypothetical protein